MLRVLCLLLLTGALPVTAETTEDCYTRCEGFGEWVYGRGWQVPPYETKVMGECLQRSTSEVGTYDEKNGGNGYTGQGDLVQDAMKASYAKIIDTEIMPGGVKNKTEQESLLAGFNAVSEGSTATGSEGLYYCVQDQEEATANAFYWVLNCGLLQDIDSPDAGYCTDVTDSEKALLDGGYMLGFVVDATLLGDDKFHRYVFSATEVLATETDPLAAYSFDCSGRPWFVADWKCESPVAVSCPTRLEGSTGLGSFQTYGSPETAVVSQDLKTWQLCVCLQDLTCSSGWSMRLGWVAVGTVALVFASLL